MDFEAVSPDTALTFSSGQTMKNRFMLAPLTNTQSHADGRLSDGERNWLRMRAQGQFGLVMTCATSVQHAGKCWSGQLGIYDERHLPGHRLLTEQIKEQGSLAVSQLHHGGIRADPQVTGEQAVGPSETKKHQARGLSLAEVERVRDDFIAAAQRAQQVGYDGVEIHGAHGYLIAQFLSPELNQREDAYGGSLENRFRLMQEILEGIRVACGPNFLLGVRLSPERFGMVLDEVKAVSQWLIDSEQLDFLDISLWDTFKQPEGPNSQGPSLLEHFTSLDRKKVKLTVAGKIHGGKEVHRALALGVDFVTIGRSGILHHDFPARVMQDEDFEPQPLPVTQAYLRQEGLSDPFIDYMRRWEGFVEG
ncbi:MAG: NADH:flavin oxidoreductase [Bacteroidota bacterium]